MNRQGKTNPDDFFWVITVTERSKETDTGWFESLLGLGDDDGSQFVPVTKEREDAESLLRRMPPAENPDTLRQVEAMNRALIKKQAEQYGFGVYVVDGLGHIKQRLEI